MIQLTNEQFDEIRVLQTWLSAEDSAAKLSDVIGCPEHLFSTDTQELRRKAA